MHKLPLVLLCLVLLSACATGQAKTGDWQGLSPEEAVQKRLALDSRLEGARLSVKFEGGIATLTGEVDSLGQKTIAQEDLYEVRGVRKVVNNISVRPPQVSDREIARSILDAIPSHCLVETENIEVDVENGDVMLTGRSKRLHHKDVIMSITTFTRGVRSVDNRIHVMPELGEGKKTDIRLRKNVEGVIGALPINIEIVNIEVQNGEVKLSGQANSYKELRELEKAVRNIAGVVKVDNNINVPHTFYDVHY